MLDRRAALRLMGLSALAVAAGGCSPAVNREACRVFPIDPDRATVLDGFDRANGPIGIAGTGQAWQQDAGTWTIDAGRAVATPRYREEVCTAAVDCGSPDGSLEIVVTLSPTVRRANAGAVLRCIDADDNLFVKLERTPVNPGGMIAIGKKQDRAVTYLASRTSGIRFDNGDTVRVLVRFEGARIDVHVSSCEVLGHTLDDEDLRRFGGVARHGLRVNAAPDDDDGRSSFQSFRFAPPA